MKLSNLPVVIITVLLIVLLYDISASLRTIASPPTTTTLCSACDPMEYQITLEDSGTYVYDGNRYVGFIPFDSTSAMDKLFIKDNE